MQKRLAMLGLGCLLLILPGCGSAPSCVTGPADTFTTPTDEATNPPPTSAGERRLVTATSTDGLRFTSTGKIFTEQGNVLDGDSANTLSVNYIQDMAVTKLNDGTYRMVYTWWAILSKPA